MPGSMAENAAAPKGKFAALVSALRERRAIKVLSAPLFLVAAAWLVQVASAPGGRLGETLGHFAKGFWPQAGGVLVLLACWLALWALTNRARLAAAVVVAGWLAAAFANAAKLSSLEVPLVPLDVYRSGDVASVFHAGLLAPEGWLKPILLVLLALPVAAAVLLLPSPKVRPKVRAGGGLAAAALLATLFFPATNVFAKGLFPDYPWNSRATCEEDGFVAYFAKHCRHVRAEAPGGYSEESVARIIRELPPATAKTSDLRPNLVLILSESFTDPTRYPAMEFDTDPVPTLHVLQKEFGRLDLVSPVFGGLTCNAELEVLTGFNMRFFPESEGAWIDAVRRPIPSLASILRSKGYRALALHAVGGLHNDMQVQPLLGFERCIPGTEWKGAERIDWRVTDESATREVVKRAAELEHPWFLCVNTIEGHVPCDGAKYKGASCGVKFTRPLSEKTKEQFTSYTFGLSRADKALASLIAALRDAKEPTLVIFYGDHLPDLGDAWRDSGWDSGARDDRLRMRTVPLVIWNNFGKRLPEFERPVGMSRVLALVLDLMEIDKPAHVRLEEKFAAKWPVISVSGCWDAAGNPVSLDDADLADYRLMQYDLLFGKNYFSK